MRLLAGLLAAQPFPTELIGDASLSKRPMGRIIEPLSAMGATLHGSELFLKVADIDEAQGASDTQQLITVLEGASTEATQPFAATADGENRFSEKKHHPPLSIHGRALQPICYRLPIPSAQVKSAILLAALCTPGETVVVEPTICRDHTERMLVPFQGICSSSIDEQQARTIRLVGPQKLKACTFQVPGDISSAAFWIVAAAARIGSHLCLEDVGLNPTRTGFLDVLKRMGAQLSIAPHPFSQGEPFGTITITGAPLRGTVIHGSEISNVIDELPILAIAGALAQGTTIIKDAKELRVKETDRISAMVNNLRAMGAHVIEHEDGMEIQGGAPLHGTTLPSYGDHRIAMACAIAGLFAEGTTLIEDTDCIATSYPDFETVLHALALKEKN